MVTIQDMEAVPNPADTPEEQFGRFVKVREDKAWYGYNVNT